MVRKKRKVPSSQQADDVLAVRKRGQYAGLLHAPALSYLHTLPGWDACGGPTIFGGGCATVHLQLQALQAHRRKLRDALRRPAAAPSAVNTSASVPDLGDPARCAALVTFLIALVASSGSSKFHKIAGLMLDDAWRLQPEACGTAATEAMRHTLSLWSGTTTTTATTATADVVSVAEALTTLVVSSVITNQVLCNPALVVQQVVPTVMARLVAEFRAAGCGLQQTQSLDAGLFSRHEETVGKLLRALLMLMQVPAVRDAMSTADMQWPVSLNVAAHDLIACLEQLLQSPTCAKDTLTMVSISIVLLARARHAATSSPASRPDDVALGVSLLSGTFAWPDTAAASAAASSSTSVGLIRICLTSVCLTKRSPPTASAR